MKEDAEKQEDKLQYFAQVTSPEQKERELATPQDNSVDANELEAALAHMKQMQNDQLTAPPPRCGFWVRICQFVSFWSEFVTEILKKGGRSLRTSSLSWTPRIEM